MPKEKKRRKSKDEAASTNAMVPKAIPSVSPPLLTGLTVQRWFSHRLKELHSAMNVECDYWLPHCQLAAGVMMLKNLTIAAADANKIVPLINISEQCTILFRMVRSTALPEELIWHIDDKLLATLRIFATIFFAFLALERRIFSKTAMGIDRIERLRSFGDEMHLISILLFPTADDEKSADVTDASAAHDEDSAGSLGTGLITPVEPTEFETLMPLIIHTFCSIFEDGAADDCRITFTSFTTQYMRHCRQFPIAYSNQRKQFIFFSDNILKPMLKGLTLGSLENLSLTVSANTVLRQEMIMMMKESLFSDSILDELHSIPFTTHSPSSPSEHEEDHMVPARKKQKRSSSNSASKGQNKPHKESFGMNLFHAIASTACDYDSIGNLAATAQQIELLLKTFTDRTYEHLLLSLQASTQSTFDASFQLDLVQSRKYFHRLFLFTLHLLDAIASCNFRTDDVLSARGQKRCIESTFSRAQRFNVKAFDAIAKAASKDSRCVAEAQHWLRLFTLRNAVLRICCESMKNQSVPNHEGTLSLLKHFHHLAKSAVQDCASILQLSTSSIESEILIICSLQYDCVRYISNIDHHAVTGENLKHLVATLMVDDSKCQLLHHQQEQQSARRYIEAKYELLRLVIMIHQQLRSMVTLFDCIICTENSLLQNTTEGKKLSGIEYLLQDQRVHMNFYEALLRMPSAQFPLLWRSFKFDRNDVILRMGFFQCTLLQALIAADTSTVRSVFGSTGHSEASAIEVREEQTEIEVIIQCVKGLTAAITMTSTGKLSLRNMSFRRVVSETISCLLQYITHRYAGDLNLFITKDITADNTVFLKCIEELLLYLQQHYKMIITDVSDAHALIDCATSVILLLSNIEAKTETKCNGTSMAIDVMKSILNDPGDYVENQPVAAVSLIELLLNSITIWAPVANENNNDGNAHGLMMRLFRVVLSSNLSKHSTARLRMFLEHPSVQMCSSVCSSISSAFKKECEKLCDASNTDLHISIPSLFTTIDAILPCSMQMELLPSVHLLLSSMEHLLVLLSGEGKMLSQQHRVRCLSSVASIAQYIIISLQHLHGQENSNMLLALDVLFGFKRNNNNYSLDRYVELMKFIRSSGQALYKEGESLPDELLHLMRMITDICFLYIFKDNLGDAKQCLERIFGVCMPIHSKKLLLFDCSIVQQVVGNFTTALKCDQLQKLDNELLLLLETHALRYTDEQLERICSCQHALDESLFCIAEVLVLLGVIRRYRGTSEDSFSKKLTARAALVLINIAPPKATTIGAQCMGWLQLFSVTVPVVMSVLEVDAPHDDGALPPSHFVRTCELLHHAFCNDDLAPSSPNMLSMLSASTSLLQAAAHHHQYSDIKDSQFIAKQIVRCFYERTLFGVTQAFTHEEVIRRQYCRMLELSTLLLLKHLDDADCSDLQQNITEQLFLQHIHFSREFMEMMNRYNGKIQQQLLMTFTSSIERVMERINRILLMDHNRHEKNTFISVKSIKQWLDWFYGVALCIVQRTAIPTFIILQVLRSFYQALRLSAHHTQQQEKLNTTIAVITSTITSYLDLLRDEEMKINKIQLNKRIIDEVDSDRSMKEQQETELRKCYHLLSRIFTRISHSKVLEKHIPSIAAAVVCCLGRHPVTAAVKEALFPGFFTFFEKCNSKQKTTMFAMLTAETRLLMNEVHDEFMRNFKFVGK